MSLLSNENKISQLKWFDILVLTIIFWGSSIVTSTQFYIALCQGTMNLEGSTDFTAADNYRVLYSQGTLLAIAIIYLFIRRFDFSSLNIKFSFKAIIWGIVLFIGAGLIQDVYSVAMAQVEGYLPFPSPLGNIVHNEMLSTVIYSLFNGFYEEIYFLGFCLAVPKNYLKWVIPFSILIRTSFHTYQGMISAVGVGVIFGVYMLYGYKKSKSGNLLPFFIAHAFGDIYGLSICQFFGM